MDIAFVFWGLSFSFIYLDCNNKQWQSTMTYNDTRILVHKYVLSLNVLSKYLVLFPTIHPQNFLKACDRPEGRKIQFLKSTREIQTWPTLGGLFSINYSQMPGKRKADKWAQQCKVCFQVHSPPNCWFHWSKTGGRFFKFSIPISYHTLLKSRC